MELINKEEGEHAIGVNCVDEEALYEGNANSSSSTTILKHDVWIGCFTPLHILARFFILCRDLIDLDHHFLNDAEHALIGLMS